MGKKSTVWKLLLYVKSISHGVSMVICTSIANVFVIRLNIPHDTFLPESTAW